MSKSYASLQPKAPTASPSSYEHVHSGGSRQRGLARPLIEKGSWIQAKLTVNQPGDKYEVEADEMARQVMIQPGSFRSGSTQQVQGTACMHRPLYPRISPLAQGESVDSDRPSPQCQEMTAEEEDEQEEESAQRQVWNGFLQREEINDEDEEEDMAQAKEVSAVKSSVPQDASSADGQPPSPKSPQESHSGRRKTDTWVERGIRAGRATGHPLQPSLRREMESHFGVDFGRVRIHTDGESSRLSRALNAKAFTVGNDIFFRQGQYAPDSAAGRQLLAHELTHVVQQNHSEIRRQVMDVAQEPARPPLDPVRQDRVLRPSLATGFEAKSSTAEQETIPARSPNTGLDTEPNSMRSDQAERDESRLVADGMVGEVGLNLDLAGEDQVHEEIPPPEPLDLSGSSEGRMMSFVNATASQKAVSFASLGTSVVGQLNSEKKMVADTTPPLKAHNGGLDKIADSRSEVLGENQKADIRDGVTEKEPGRLSLEPHQDLAKAPDNQRSARQLDKQEPEGFLSWFRDRFTNFLGGIATTDHGLNTRAGNRPEVDLSGKANPKRARVQRNEGQVQVENQKNRVSEQIQHHPGQSNIQPVEVNEETPLPLNSDSAVEIVTENSDGMSDYASLPLPADARQAADQRMAPLLEESMTRPREDIAAAAGERDDEQTRVLDQAREDNEKQNEQARNEQKEIVLSSRKRVADDQVEGIRDAQKQIDEFNTEADHEQDQATKEVTDRAVSDGNLADKEFQKGEKDAEARKSEGEREARRKKEQLERESENDSWWDRAVNAVKKAVKAITKVIDGIFEAVRSAVKFIIEKAKDAALKLIEAGRKWIVDKLDKFGTWLKNKVNKYLSAFPALQKRINAAIDSTVNKAKDLVNKAADNLKKGVEALASAVAGFLDAILAKFQAAMKAAVQVVGALLTGDFSGALKIAFLAICDMIGINSQPILDFINRAGSQLGNIFKNPAAFFGKVARGIKMGLDGFFKRIRKHLLGGLVGWLTGAISEAGITLPEKWDVRGVFSLVMQILGLTYQNIRARVVKKLGPKADRAISFVENHVGLVKKLILQGPVVLWERVKDTLGDLKKKVFGEIAKYISIAVIKEGILWLISLLNPASAIVKAVKLLFDLVMFLINRGRQIVEFVKSVYNSIVELATGKLEKAAAAVEDALARTIPVVISFMAALLGLGGIGKTVKKIMASVQKPINKALDKVIDFIVRKGKAFLVGGKDALKKGAGKAREKLAGIFGFLRRFKTRKGDSHRVAVEGSPSKPKIVVASVKTDIEQWLIQARKTIKAGKEGTDKDDAAVLTLLGQALEQSRKVKRMIALAKKKGNLPGAQRILKELVPKIQKIMDATMEEDATSLLPSKIIYQSTVGGYASKMEAFILTHKGAKGSETNPSQLKSLNPEYGDLLLRRQSEGGRSYYVAGHLLNANLHGPGNDWRNLTPLTQDANGVHSRQVEEPLKKAVRSGLTVRYTVTPTGQLGPNQGLITQIQNSAEDPDRIRDKVKIIKAESKVPQSLQIDAKQIKLEERIGQETVAELLLKNPTSPLPARALSPVSGAKSSPILNKVGRGSANDYFLKGTKARYVLRQVSLINPVPARIEGDNELLSTIRSSAPDKLQRDWALKALRKIRGIGAGRAETLLSEKNKIKPEDWDSLENVSGIGPKLSQSIYEQRDQSPKVVLARDTLWKKE